MLLLYGFLTGIVLCLTFGTIFFALVQNSIDFGYKAGIQIAFGVVVCDFLFVVVALFSSSLPFLSVLSNYKNSLMLLGIIALCILGYQSIFGSPTSVQYPQTKVGIAIRGNYFYFFGLGFLLNVINPVNFLSWVGIATYLRHTMNYTLAEQILFFALSLLAVFMTESAIGFYAHRLKEKMSPTHIQSIRILTGLVFFGIALKLAWSIYL